jgi:hypothetical protein
MIIDDGDLEWSFSRSGRTLQKGPSLHLEYQQPEDLLMRGVGQAWAELSSAPVRVPPTRSTATV